MVFIVQFFGFLPSFLRFSGFGFVGRGSSPFRLSGASSFPLQFSFFVFSGFGRVGRQFSIVLIRISERPPVFTPSAMASSWSSYSGVHFSGFSGAVHLLFEFGHFTISCLPVFRLAVHFQFSDAMDFVSVECY